MSGRKKIFSITWMDMNGMLHTSTTESRPKWSDTSKVLVWFEQLECGHTIGAKLEWGGPRKSRFCIYCKDEAQPRKNLYLAHYEGQKLEVRADTNDEAQRISAEIFKVQPHQVNLFLMEENGKRVY